MHTSNYSLACPPAHTPTCATCLARSGHLMRGWLFSHTSMSSLCVVCGHAAAQQDGTGGGLQEHTPRQNTAGAKCLCSRMSNNSKRCLAHPSSFGVLLQLVPVKTKGPAPCLCQPNLLLTLLPASCLAQESSFYPKLRCPAAKSAKLLRPCCLHPVNKARGAGGVDCDLHERKWAWHGGVQVTGR